MWFADWGPPIKTPGYAYARILEVFVVGYFPFQPIKKQAVLKPRTGHFRGLVGFETNAKDLSFEAKAKHFKIIMSSMTPLLVWKL